MKIAVLMLTGGLVDRGVEISMRHLAQAWVKLGHQVTVIQTGPKPAEASYQIIQVKLPFAVSSHKPRHFVGKILERLYLDRRGLATLLFSLKIFFIKNWKLKIKNCDIIIPTDGFWQVLLTKLLCRQTKIVCIGHAGMGWTDADTLKLNPALFVATSPTSKLWAQTQNPKIKITTLPLPIDTHLFAFAQPAPVSLPLPVILSVSALTPYKRIDQTIRAVSQLPQASLLIVGQGEDYHRLKSLAQKLLPHRHQFLSVSFTALPGIYKSCQVFTLVSEPREAFGQVLLEAMAANLPIVTTSDPIRRWIVGDHGYFIDPADIRAYTAALNAALASAETLHYDLRRFELRYIAQTYLDKFNEL